MIWTNLIPQLSFSSIDQSMQLRLRHSFKGWFSLAHKCNISITSENTRDISVSISKNIKPGWFSLAHKHNISITSENIRDISVSISRNIRRTNPVICLMLFSLAHKHKRKRLSISISSRKTNMFVFLVLMLMLMRE